MITTRNRTGKPKKQIKFPCPMYTHICVHCAREYTSRSEVVMFKVCDLCALGVPEYYNINDAYILLKDY